MDLRELRDTLLRIDHPEKLLLLADKYLTQVEELGDDFILPKDHVIIKPILEYYSGDLPGWLKFVKGVRDRLPMAGRKFHEGVNDLYRTLEVRLTQQERRERLDRAVATAVAKKLISNDTTEKIRYARRCTQSWKMRRENLLKVTASQTGNNRLSVAERETLLHEFWQQIDEEIYNGELPKP